MTSDDQESTLAHNLDALAARTRTRSTAALIRHYLPKIEAAKNAGASTAEILQSFRQAGFDIPASTFQSTLSRMRKKTRNTQSSNTQSEPKRQPSTAQDKPALRKRRGLEMPDPPKAFHWDPLERPNITFIDDDDKEK